MSDVSWAATVRLVHERARNYCEYCQTYRDMIGQAMHVEHIDPNGGDSPANLCLACPTCNLSKATATSALDPATGVTVPLFNPRTQRWQDHFMWIENARRVQGLTPTGRATVERLHMNQARLVVARSLWVKAHCHPPTFEA
jgi:HNH endonuclease